MALTAAQIALEAGANPEWERGTEVFPVHVFLPVEKAQSRELLIHVDRPLAVRQFLNAAAGRTEVTLASALEERWQANAFRQQDQDVEQFLSDLEGALRQDLEEEWSSRENWKQKVDGFHLSSALAGWMRELNTLNPGRLAALREMVEAWREAKRRAALRQIELETAHGWLESAAQRTWVWAATVAASPLALYGLINHAVILLLLAWGGLLGHESDRDPRVAWLLRGAVTLGCYTMQVILCSTLLGRAAAGYYAPTLPLSGALLWAYAWLWRHGTRPVMMRLTLRAQREKTRRMRKELVREIDRGMLVAS